LDELIHALGEVEKPSSWRDTRSIRYYSATFGTDWHGSEGLLVVDCLARLIAGSSSDSLFGYVDYGKLAHAG
ncbi:MAG TPA: hypothetical protein VM553_05505, partial [Dongiaceae bacterium]|nr:hypothetical protein [Dongiaceae bacterium]